MFEEYGKDAASGAGIIERTWRKAGRCTSGSCLEVLLGSPTVAVRDSKDLSADPNTTSFPYLEVSTDRWSTFLSEVMGDTPPGSNGSIFFSKQADGNVVLTASETEVALTYDAEEWVAFEGGVADGDFDISNAAAT